MLCTAVQCWVLGMLTRVHPATQTYKRHERSREAIELAYDAILQQKMRVRHRLGFQPPQRGKKRDAQGDALVSRA